MAVALTSGGGPTTATAATERDGDRGGRAHDVGLPRAGRGHARAGAHVHAGRPAVGGPQHVRDAERRDARRRDRSRGGALPARWAAGAAPLRSAVGVANARARGHRRRRRPGAEAEPEGARLHRRRGARGQRPLRLGDRGRDRAVATSAGGCADRRHPARVGRVPARSCPRHGAARAAGQSCATGLAGARPQLDGPHGERRAGPVASAARARRRSGADPTPAGTEHTRPGEPDRRGRQRDRRSDDLGQLPGGGLRTRRERLPDPGRRCTVSDGAGDDLTRPSPRCSRSRSGSGRGRRSPTPSAATCSPSRSRRCWRWPAAATPWQSTSAAAGP